MTHVVWTISTELKFKNFKIFKKRRRPQLSMKRTSTQAGMRYVRGSRSAKKRARQPRNLVLNAPRYNPKAEVKYTDRSLYNNSSTNTGSIFSLHHLLVRGDDVFNNFEGNVVYPVGLSIKWACETNQSYNYVRLMFFQWMDGSVPTISDVLQDTTTGIGTMCAVHVNTKGIMNVLYDKHIVIAPSAGGGSAATVLGWGPKNGKTYIPGKRMCPIRFKVGTNTVMSGTIYCLMLSDDSLATYPTVSLYTRLAYRD